MTLTRAPRSFANISYDLWDLGEFDQKGAKPTHWGSKEDLLAAIKEAKKHKIITYIDAVLNHKVSAESEPEPAGRGARTGLGSEGCNVEERGAERSDAGSRARGEHSVARKMGSEG